MNQNFVHFAAASGGRHIQWCKSAFDHEQFGIGTADGHYVKGELGYVPTLSNPLSNDPTITHFLTVDDTTWVASVVERYIQTKNEFLPYETCGGFRSELWETLSAKLTTAQTIKQYEFMVCRIAVMMAYGMIAIARAYGLPDDYGFPTDGWDGPDSGAPITYREALVGYRPDTVGILRDLYPKRIFTESTCTPRRKAHKPTSKAAKRKVKAEARRQENRRKNGRK